MPPSLFAALSAALIALFVGLELRRTRSFRDGLWRDRGRAGRNLAYLLASLAAVWGVRAVSGALDGRLPQALDLGSHPVLDLLGCLVVGELLNWVVHWAKHRSDFLWKLHFQHHREENYDLWLVTHTHALEVVVSGTLIAATLVAVGFSPLALEVYLLFYSAANQYQHSAGLPSIPWLDRLVVGPAYHRHHHGVRSAVNFGSALTLWDRVFGTARWPAPGDRETLEYGIGDGPEPWGFAEEMTWFLKRSEPAPGGFEEVDGAIAGKQPS